MSPFDRDDGPPPDDGALEEPFPEAKADPFADLSPRRISRPSDPFEVQWTPKPVKPGSDGDPFATVRDTERTPPPPQTADPFGPLGAPEQPPPRVTPAPAPPADDLFHLSPPAPLGQTAPSDPFEKLVSHLSSEEPEPTPRPSPGSRSWWLLVVVGVAVIAAGAGWFLLGRPGLPGSEATAPPEPAPAVTNHQPPVESASAPGGDSASATQPAQAAPDAAVPSSGTELPAGGAKPPAQADVQPARPASPATALASASFHREGSQTVIELELDGHMEGRRIGRLDLDNPPRILLKLSGITAERSGWTVPVATPEVSRIRFGLHREVNPVELHVVVDLEQRGVRLAWSRTEGRRLLLAFSGPGR